MSRCRAPYTPSPIYLSRHAFSLLRRMIELHIRQGGAPRSESKNTRLPGATEQLLIGNRNISALVMPLRSTNSAGDL